MRVLMYVYPYENTVCYVMAKERDTVQNDRRITDNGPMLSENQFEDAMLFNVWLLWWVRRSFD